MAFVETYKTYLTDLSDTPDELIEAIHAKNGVFVIYGDGNNGKTTFIQFLKQHQSLKFANSNNIDRVIQMYPECDGIVVEEPEHIDYTHSHKIWYLTNEKPSGKYIHFNRNFRTQE
jgi:hypothetical protein